MIKPSIILDIDRTLIKSIIYTINQINEIKCVEPNNLDYIVKLKPELKNIIQINGKISYDELYLTHFQLNDNICIVLKRPYLEDFLHLINKYFNIYIYSSGSDKYINNIVDALEKLIQYKPFKKVIANKNNIYEYIKKSSKLNIGYTNMLIIDDNPYHWTFDKHNLYTIKPYTKPYIINHTNLFYLDPFMCCCDKLCKTISNDKELYYLMNRIEEYFIKFYHDHFNIYIFKNLKK